jgi:uncharacterized protein
VLQSLYVPMSDGVRIAVDLWLPPQAAAEKVPTLMRATRYQRATRTESDDPDDNANAAEAKLWLDRSYALVVVDARGSGASFGMRTSELSPEEVRDYGEVVDWIGAQPWSNGRVGSYGVSYDGNTAEHVARNGSKHLVAIAPQFSDFDPFRQTIFPGGAYFAPFDGWLGQVQALDGIDGAAERLAEMLGVDLATLQQQMPGVTPVDGPEGDALLEQALAEHQANVVLNLEEFDHRDDRLWDDSAVPTHRNDLEASGVAVFVQVGWVDAGTVVGALERFTTFSLSQDVWIGPWPHGGGKVIDTVKDAGLQPSFDDLSSDDQFERLAAFFDRHVRDGAPPDGARRLRFTTMNAEGWTDSDVWPLPDVSDQQWYLAGGSLGRDLATSAETFELPTSPHSTGAASRWYGQLGSDVSYDTWADTVDGRRSFMSAPLESALTIVGFPVITVDVISSEPDGLLLAYLEMIRPDGVRVPVTEGSLRLSRRGPTQPEVRTDRRLDRSFAAADNADMTPGAAARVTFELLPIAAMFEPGAVLVLSFASSDTDNFRAYAAAGSPLTLSASPDRQATLVLPVRS